MAKSRKDPRGRMLRKGESWREQDQRYTYTYTNPLGRSLWVYLHCDFYVVMIKYCQVVIINNLKA